MSIEYENEKVPFINLGQGYKIRLEFEEITNEEYLKKARDELRETEELKQQALREFRQMIESESDFIYPLADLFLLTFLRPAKFYVKSAFERLQRFFKFNLKHKKVCENLTVDSVKAVFEDGLLKYLPLRDLEGQRLMYVHCGRLWKPARASPTDIFRAVQLSCFAAMSEPLTQVNGVSIILDMDGLSLSQICHFTPSFAAMLLEWIQVCIPIRLKAVYVVNNSYVFNMLFAIFKPFIGAKLRKRIHFLNKDFKVLTEHIGSDRVGKQLGGTLPVHDVAGTVLVEFLHLYDKQYEIIECSGYEVNEDRIKRMNEGLEEVLTFINPSAA